MYCTEFEHKNFEQFVLKQFPKHSAIESLKDEIDEIREQIKLRTTFEDVEKESQ